MTPGEERLSKEALKFVKSHKDFFIEKFASDSRFPSIGTPVSIFMAGSPGAGKTEFSRRFIEKQVSNGSSSIVRIDPDSIREHIPQYIGGNAYVFQRAVSWGVDKLHEYVLKKKKHFILDGTFSNEARSRENVKRSLNRGRKVLVLYVYQDPLVAWDFTKAREKIEGRKIPKESFIDQLFGAREVVKSVKKDFGKKVSLSFLEKDYRNDDLDFKLNIEDIDGHLSIDYTRDELNDLLK